MKKAVNVQKKKKNLKTRILQSNYAKCSKKDIYKKK